MRALNQFHRFSICLIWEIKGVWSAILKITYPESISATQPHWAIISGNAYSWKHLAVCGHSRTGFHCWRTALETHMLHVDLCHEYSDSRSMRVVVVVLVAQSCPALCDPMQSPPGSSVHGILQARILKWVAIPFSRASSQPKDTTQVSHTARRFFLFCFVLFLPSEPPGKPRDIGWPRTIPVYLLKRRKTCNSAHQPNVHRLLYPYIFIFQLPQPWGSESVQDGCLSQPVFSSNKYDC